jgi:hypothetical protein
MKLARMLSRTVHSGTTYLQNGSINICTLSFNGCQVVTQVNERQGADIQSKVQELNQSLRNRDKMKDDAIAQLSDQVMALTARMQEFERKQQS